jgi:hypothetical protein
MSAKCAVPSIAAIAGGLSVWRLATAETPFNGGTPVSVSLAGHIIFLSIGAAIGFATGILLVLFNARASNRRSWRLVTAMSLPLGSAVAIGIFVVLIASLVAIPREWFDVFTD